ncbi:MAG: hypothetical protein HYX96_04190 [Chloroflexi bacterium]|nr:hypothetical protein [Chloroflexota bacterium]
MRTSEADCVHFWKLGQPVKGICRGICKLCGAERDFPSAWDKEFRSPGSRPPVSKLKGVNALY